MWKLLDGMAGKACEVGSAEASLVRPARTGCGGAQAFALISAAWLNCAAVLGEGNLHHMSASNSPTGVDVLGVEKLKVDR